MVGELIKRNKNEENQKYSIIHWQTGEPKERGEYLVQLENGSFDLEVLALYEGYTKTYSVWSRYKNSDVVAWCKLSDIKPYKETTNG